MIIEKVYNGRNNTIELLLKAEGVSIDLAAVSRMQLVMGALTIDSQTTPTYFDWTHTPPVTGKVILSLGAAGLPAGETKLAKLVIFDPSNTQGIVWGSFYIEVS